VRQGREQRMGIVHGTGERDIWFFAAFFTQHDLPVSSVSASSDIASQILCHAISDWTDGCTDLSKSRRRISLRYLEGHTEYNEGSCTSAHKP
jgi:hypothetical protein